MVIDVGRMPGANKPGRSEDVPTAGWAMPRAKSHANRGASYVGVGRRSVMLRPMYQCKVAAPKSQIARLSRCRVPSTDTPHPRNKSNDPAQVCALLLAGFLKVTKR